MGTHGSLQPGDLRPSRFDSSLGHITATPQSFRPNHRHIRNPDKPEHKLQILLLKVRRFILQASPIRTIPRRNQNHLFPATKEQRGFLERSVRPTNPPEVTCIPTSRLADMDLFMHQLHNLSDKWQAEDAIKHVKVDHAPTPIKRRVA